MAQANISSFFAEPDQPEDLLRRWDVAHQNLYAYKRDAMKEQKGGHAEVVPQWPKWSGGSLRESYLSSLRKITSGGQGQHKNGSNPLSAASLSRELIKYGEMAQVTYDKLETKNLFSPYFGECRSSETFKDRLLGEDSTLMIGQDAANYKVVQLLYADSGAYKLVRCSETRKNFVGFVAVEQNVPAYRGADVAIVWRGTITREEWMQDAKAFMVAWKGGRQVADVPVNKLNLPPGNWLGLTTAAGLAAALWFARTHTAPLETFFNEVNGAASRGVCFLYNQRLLMAEHLSKALPPPARWLANVLVLEPLLALGGRVTSGLLAGIDLLGAFCIGATKSTLLVSGGTLLGIAAAAGLGIGVTSLVLSQRMFTNRSNVSLLWEDLRRAPGLLQRWLWYGVLSTAYSRMAAGDARVSYGFKEMYCDVNPEGVLVEDNLGPPRQQVFEALATILGDASFKIGSITTTGHSLGGALAALCASDIADCLNSVANKATKPVPKRVEGLTDNGGISCSALAKIAKTATSTGDASVLLSALESYEKKAALSDETEELYKKTEGAIDRCREAVEANLKRSSTPMSPVTAVTFGAPRVGDRNFAAKFGTPSKMTPPWVPAAFFLNIPVAIDRLVSTVSSACWWATSHGVDLENFLAWFVWTYAIFMSAWLLGWHALPATPFWRPAWTSPVTYLFLLLAASWQSFPVVVIVTSAIWRTLRPASALADSKDARCQLRMLRVVNSGDAVPRVPLGPLFGGRWYRHGGIEMRRSPYIIPVFMRFQEVPLLGNVLGARLASKHNLEVYLHMVDPTRDRHLMNKSADVLVKTCGVPPCWYEPVLNKGLVWDPDTGLVELAKEKVRRQKCTRCDADNAECHPPAR